jgi:uncharacterized membrane protein
MKERAGGTRRGRMAMIAAAVAVLGLLVASVAVANNLDRRTATDAAKQVAKQDCHATSGCKDYFVRGLHRVSRHKAVGKIIVISVKNGEKFSCSRQIVIKLDHFTGEITYAVSKRRCDDLGPA